MKNSTKVIISLVLALAVILPAVLPLFAAVLTPPKFDDTFVGALDEKFDRLNSVKGDKIVVIGGSSVAFGLDSALLEKYTGMPVVNFGLYAALGTKLMLDLSLSGIEEGDVVVISPEMDRQTLSLYFNADTAWRAIEGDLSMLRYIKFSNYSEMLASAYGYAREKLLPKKVDTGSDNTVYLSKYFNEYGDFTGYARAENVMTAYYDKNTPIELCTDAYGEELTEFFDYLNAYIKKCEGRGATVYFSYAPMNSLAITERSGGTVKEDFEEYLMENINCEFITSLDTATFDAGYFFNTNFHLNDAGMRARTLRLARDLRLALGITGGIVEKEPEAPALPEVEVRFDGYDENSKYFLYERTDSGSYAIIGLTDEGKEMKSLTLPLGYEGYKVTSVRGGAFANSALESLTVTENSNLVIFENGAFVGAGKLSDLWLYKKSGDSIAPPASFVGVSKDFTVHVPEGSDYAYHYYWSERGLTFAFDAN